MGITSNSTFVYMKRDNIQTFKNIPVISRTNRCATIDFQLEYNKKYLLRKLLNLDEKNIHLLTSE